MSERYTKLFTLPENLYTEGAPVVVSAGALLKDNQTGKVLAQLKIKNITNKAIKAAKIRITPFDTVENPLDEELEHEYLDLNVQRDDEFGQKAPITLANASTRSFSVCVNEVIFSDNSIWNYNGGEWYSLSVQESLEKVLNDDRQLVKQYKIEYGKQCKFEIAEDRDLWLCSCGNINHNDEDACHRCGCELEALKSVDMAELEEKKNIRLAEEKRQKEKEKEAEKNKTKKAIKISVAFVSIIVILITSGVFAVKYHQKSTIYNNAIALVEENKFSEAIETFESLGHYKDSADMLAYTNFAADLSKSFANVSDTEIIRKLAEKNAMAKDIYTVYNKYKPYCGTFECVTKGVNDDIIEERIISDFYYENGKVHWYDTNEDGYYPMINYALHYQGKTIYKFDSVIFSTNNIVNDTTINDVINGNYYMDGNMVANIKFKDNQIIYSGKYGNNKTLTLKYSKTK